MNAPDAKQDDYSLVWWIFVFPIVVLFVNVVYYTTIRPTKTPTGRKLGPTDRLHLDPRSAPEVPRRGPERLTSTNRHLGPELVLRLLVARVLLEYRGLPVLHRPDVDLRRRPVAAAAPGALGAEHDDALALGQHVIDPQPERAGGQRHEVPEEAEHLGMSTVVACQRSAPGNVPEDVLGKRGERAVDVPTGERVVGARDQGAIGLGRGGLRSLCRPASHLSSRWRHAIAGRIGEPDRGRAAATALEGRHPCFCGIEHAVELLAGGDAELAVGAGEVAFDRLDRHVQLLGDLTVRASRSGQLDDAQLARRQRLDADAPVAARTRTSDTQLLAGTGRQGPGAAARGAVEAL